ncbi:MAG: spermidine/putrescine ABC transporter substrate-binding protein, partial [Actinomycetes bacterium]
MSDSNEPIRILAPSAAADRISRRLFLASAAGAAIGGSALLSACGDDESSTSGGAAAPAGQVEDQLNMFTWGEYNSPHVISDFEDEE